MSSFRGRRGSAGRARNRPDPSLLDALYDAAVVPCTARGCKGLRTIDGQDLARWADRWVTVRDRASGTLVVYPVCPSHVDAVWLWLGCDEVQDCGPEVHALSTGSNVDDLVQGLAIAVAEGHRVGFAQQGDWSRRNTLERVAS